jgi:hypothetical protein
MQVNAGSKPWWKPVIPLFINVTLPRGRGREKGMQWMHPVLNWGSLDKYGAVTTTRLLLCIVMSSIILLLGEVPAGAHKGEWQDK